MGSPAFRFSLEARRVVVAAARDATLGELAELERERRRARGALRDALKNQRGVAQRLTRELDEQFRRPLGSARAHEWTWSCQYLEQLRELLAQCERATQRRREQLALVELKLENKRQELSERQQQADALERARQREWAAHLRERERAEERRRDDDAPLHWARAKRESKERA